MTHQFRRRVLYIPGFDPFPPRRYRELYRREGALQATISGYDLTLHAVQGNAVVGQQSRPKGGDGYRHYGWRTVGRFLAGNTGEIREAEANFEILVWDDLVQASMRQGVAATYLQLARTAGIYLGSGALWRLTRLRRAPVLAALYPVVVLSAQLLIALAMGIAVALVAARLGLPWPLAVIFGGALVWALLMACRAMDHRVFAHYLMHDYAYVAQHRGAYPPALERRLATFADRLRQALAEDVDEVLVVGHSSGAYLAVSLLADVLRAGAGPRDAPLALLTLGHVVPMVSFLPGAGRLRADLAFLGDSPDLCWVDVSAPGDACCFGLCDPVAVTGVAGPAQRGPLVLSAAFRDTLSPTQQARLRGRWFRLHFQYLCAFERPGAYDYFAITAGPMTLARRFAGRRHSPGRITRPVGPGRD